MDGGLRRGGRQMKIGGDSCYLLYVSLQVPQLADRG